ncbi:MAG: hypothetical protein A2283_17740 [Lentisphaerae bacterium RIFOXYA12_FULL_48_11]|nr:MAG: hypothetical protein A2283_17740 [Lentisphaerae bacterium RIFOXYA12_FULL_48_11]
MKYKIIIILFLTTVVLVLSEEAKAGKIEVVGQASIDFGKYPAAEKKVATYTIRNVGNDVLKIINIRKTCGCASATCNKQELRPKEDAIVEVIILPNSIFGSYIKNTYVESSDPGNRFLCLGLSGNAIPLVAIIPGDTIHVGRIATNTCWAQSIELKANNPDVKLGEPVTQSNYPIKTIIECTGQKTTAYKLHLSLTATNSSGDLQCLILIPVITPTNNPTLKVNISGKIGTELIATPGIFRLAVSDTPVRRNITLKVLGEKTYVLNPSEVIPPKHIGISCEAKQNSDGHCIDIAVTFSPEFTKELYAEETLVLAFSLPGISSATLICKSKK